MALVVLVVVLSLAGGGVRAAVGPPTDEATKVAFVLLAKPRLPDGKQLERAFARFATKECQLRERVEKDQQGSSKALAFELTPVAADLSGS